MMTKVTPELEKRIAEKYIVGNSTREIAKEFGFSSGGIWDILDGNDVKKRTKSQALKGKPSKLKGKKLEPFSVKHKQNISKSKQGQRKGLPSWNKGKKCPQIIILCKECHNKQPKGIYKLIGEK